MQSLKRFLASKTFDAQHVESELQLIIEHQHWKICGFKDIDAYLTAEIGATFKQLRSRLAQDLAEIGKTFAGALRQKIDAEDRENQRPPGRPKTVSNENNVTDSFKGRPHSGTRAEALRRLRDNRPDIHARVLVGELSPHAGMIEAGFRKKTVRKRRSPIEQVRKLLPKLTAEERRQIHDETGDA
jgi:hypothetical protein